MEKLPKRQFTAEFKHEAVCLVRESGLSLAEIARNLSIAVSTLHNWVCEAKSGTAIKKGKPRRLVSDEEAQIAKLQREIAELRMERDILKKAAVFFAKESR